MSNIIENENMPAKRTPDLIAAEINDIKEQTKRMLLYNSIEIGRRLIEVKSMVPHGEWGNWLKESVNYSQSTANNLMRIFKEYSPKQMNLLGVEAKSQALGNLSYTQAVALLAVPEEEREEFIEENDVSDMSTRELQQLIKERDQALKEKEKAKKKLNDAKNEAVINKEYAKRLESEKLEAEQKADKLEQKLKERPIEINAETVVEKIPEEIEKELNELREKANKVTEKDEAAIKFSVHFNELVKTFDELLKTLKEIKGPETHTKYRKAVSKLINKMSERL